MGLLIYIFAAVITQSFHNFLRSSWLTHLSFIQIIFHKPISHAKEGFGLLLKK